jgi:hypothetical protein
MPVQSLPESKCIRCGGTSHEPGSLAYEARWHRSSKSISIGWDVKASVCLDCGLVTPYLSDTDLAKLRAAVK